jgi:hypothetical protein
MKIPSAAECRKQAKTLYRRAKAPGLDAEALVFILRAIELETLADELEHDATQPPTALPQQEDR